MGAVPKREPIDGLGHHVYLEKQDKLREIGVDIPTSQIVVVGSQSSGKSSLLESLTGFSFPRGQGLCTRYATQITLRRNEAQSTELNGFDGRELASVIEKANTAMGIRSGASKDDTSLPMFSGDILKVEISGPEQPHLTVIDVPGLFQVIDEGTTELDKVRVENMVRRYMENERTIVLAVLSCLSDRATEGVLQFAKTADPEGVRTVGVLTRADLVKEQAVVQTLLQLVKGNTLKLGYFLVRNRGADEDTPEYLGWAELVKLGRTGVEALRAELQTLLTELAGRELPKQRAEVEQRLLDCRKRLESIGPARDSSASQRECLVKLASTFERIVRDALDGRYEGDPIFSDKPQLRLATEIIELNEGFSELMSKKGHTWVFDGESGEEDVGGPLKYDEKTGQVQGSVSSIPELQQLVRENMACFAPLEESYRESRGQELGTFGGSLLAMTFRAQTSKWRDIVLDHVETVIVVVHRFIKALLHETFGDERMREKLVERMEKSASKVASKNNWISVSDVANITKNKSNAEQTKEDIHDILQSYYEVSRKKFVDAICRLVVEHFLLDGRSSPLKVLTPELIAKMSDSQLDMIAGEDATTKRERERLDAEIRGLKAAMEAMRR
ncbi:hypothetical protein N658DRAFT_524846 [Parathielavia hyrcaniae]|uniref:Uncharacterized protein n=1 Tax=Parathielavia hyrcaniae TaxID=113614 RepID=A0AAN6PYF4_9PEZI|nr:hypothetical protein N658DRAFT_524846 [Parathielavia hyrcaniae]